MNLFLRPALLASLPLLLAASAASAATVSTNTGSLGAVANGTNGDTTILNQPGTVAAGGDQSVGYGAAAMTQVPFLAALNPAAGSPFTIEFWARPTSTDGDDAPLSNRTTAGNRSGWVFFQRGEAVGWNLRMYNGTGSGLGWDLTGGTATLNAWSHVVATWNGSSALLYVNGALADSTNDGAATGVYNPNVAGAPTTLSLGAISSSTPTGGSPYNGLVDEVAFYNGALTPAQILAHFNTAGSATPGAYYSLIQGDGALLQLSNIPEPSTAALLSGLTGVFLLGRRRRM